jgi:CubicO group peptidase (beta-lactamase class C family)
MFPLRTVRAGPLALAIVFAPTARLPQLGRQVPSNGTPAAIDSLFAALRRDSTHDIKGVLVLRDGAVVGESYFNGDTPETLHDIRSATKSITSLLVGIAIDRHFIGGARESLATLLGFKELGAVTLEDLLTMRSGLDDDDRDSLARGNEVRLDQSDDWVKFARGVPLVSAPGTRYVYSSLNAFLAGAVVERATHMSLQQFATGALFQPIGIQRFAWVRGPLGEGSGQGNLSIALRDMGRIGKLVLDRGVMQGRQVVSAAWVRRSLSPIVPIASVDPYADHYGYMWYQKVYVVGEDTVLVHFASGNGGNKIYIIPSQRLVIAITSSAYNKPYGQRRAEQILRTLLAALILGHRTG